MQKVFFTVILALGCFVLENVLAQIFGPYFRPNLLLILVIFFNLYRGLRYSLLAALLAGLFKDSYSVQVFGLNTFAFVVCAHVTTIVKMYIYQVGSVVSRVLIVFLMSLLNVFLLYILHVMFSPIDFTTMFVNVLVPEVVTTTVAAPFVFENLKQCASRLFA